MIDDEFGRASDEFLVALTGGDAAAAAARYRPDGWLLTADAELITGRRDIEAYWRTGIGLGLSAVELRPADMRVWRAVAVEIGRYRFAFHLDGVAPADECGKYLVLHHRQADGSWYRAAEAFNPDTSRSPTTTRDARAVPEGSTARALRGEPLTAEPPSAEQTI